MNIAEAFNIEETWNCKRTTPFMKAVTSDGIEYGIGVLILPVRPDDTSDFKLVSRI